MDSFDLQMKKFSGSHFFLLAHGSADFVLPYPVQIFSGFLHHSLVQRFSGFLCCFLLQKFSAFMDCFSS
jgi:hypothetical protein